MATSFSSTEIAHDFPPFIRVYKDARVERLLTIPIVPPSIDPLTGIQSKDVVISSIKSRIFLPKINPLQKQKLPLIVYVHGGAFCTGSPLNVATQSFLTSLVSQTSSVAIAIGYRLAPEHPLPAAYHDCWAAFQWIASHVSGAGTDPWINNYVDTSRVFLVGESAGANLVHYLAVQAGVNHTGLGVKGLMILHPYFSQKVPEKFTQYLYPGSSCSDDDPKLNPVSDPNLEKLCCSRVLTVVAEYDPLKPRGVQYYETLKKSKWAGKIEFLENEGVDHCFHLIDPSTEKGQGSNSNFNFFYKTKLKNMKKLSKACHECNLIYYLPCSCDL